MSDRQQDPGFSGGFVALFFVTVFSFLTLISSGYLDSEDGWLYASVARNMYYHHQIAAAPNEYPDLNVHMNSEKGADEVWRSHGSFGYSLSLVPAVFISDLVHEYYDAPPPERFPLEHDWVFHLFASFTNAFYGALLCVFLLKYAHLIGFSRRYSILTAVFAITITNLLPLSKFSFAHMMFNTFLLASFYYIRKFNLTQQTRFLACSALSFGLVAISYNETVYLAILPLSIFLLMLESPRQRRLTIGAGALGFAIIVIFFRAFLLSVVLRGDVSLKMLFEGVWGFLLSPGKSIFLYSPPLLLLPIFWHKIRGNMKPEVVSALLLTFFYLYLVGSATITKNELLMPIWHGGMTWGPRYISALIPLWILVVMHIIQQLSILQKRLIVVPLLILGAGIQLVGVSTSYLLQYIDLPYNFFIGKSEILVYDYASFIPRYTPLNTLSKQFLIKVKQLPETISRGQYDVRFFDGFDSPYRLPTGTIRGFREEGYISFNSSAKQPARQIRLRLFNAPDQPENGQTAEVNIEINGSKQVTITIDANQESSIEVPVTQPISGRNEVHLTSSYAKKLLAPQVIYIRKMEINDINVPLGSLDYPEVSNLGEKSSPLEYRYYGKNNTDKWAYWHMRARVNENSLNFWWIKNLYFWDRPTKLVWVGFVANLTIFFAGLTALIKSKAWRSSH